MSKIIGILNLQGAVSEHLDMTQKAINKMDIDCQVDVVRYSDEVDKCDGIIISGGESTVIGKLIRKRGIDKIIKQNKIPVFGTCAGMVLMSKKTDHDQDIFNIIPMEVERNSFGSQKNSFEREIEILGNSFHGVFIRAPSVKRICNENAPSQIDDVEILSEIDDKIIAVRQDKNIALSFHPELTEDTRLHEFYLKEVLNL
ncbi:MAG: pyridoxal 5'-phosphate synthase glutaminase subunit PdxT [Methanobrevibacter sp.]|jgi:5'-phosphate synthase pdxT subunit|nr:pyridoxal 5'-phosphate synthase glutaminase subunit PdxT [Candidatus Methanovirga australis]MDR2545722.1 pyridoxal 5'-phosphate synthase glutaminase subunit PdxT [Candidatus Methanovirga procula]